MFFRPQHLHFIGIGGIGMSGIAEILVNLGYEVSGCDLNLSPITERLQRLGVRVWQGHSPEHLESVKVVVISSAVSPENPEVQQARRLQIPVIPRGELLAELMRLKYGIAVAGSHGKTTTTSMIATVLSDAGLDPTVVVGGCVTAMGGSNARLGHSDFLVVESDESDGSFLRLNPVLAVITNIDREHLDHYRTYDALLDAFVEFGNRVPFYGATIACLDDEGVQTILPRIRRRVVTYGANPQADLMVSGLTTTNCGSEFRLRRRGEDLGTFRLIVPGVHNVLNASAAVAVGLELELELEVIRQSLERFSGVERRFQIRGQVGGITVIDDYGHHPAEIRATLETARACGYNRLVVLFQPHRYTRTQLLLDDFGRAFHQADRVIVVDIYPASEPPIPGVTAELLVQKLQEYGHRGAEYAGSLENGVARILEEAQPGDAVLTLGAGSVSKAGQWILEGLQARENRKHAAS